MKQVLSSLLYWSYIKLSAAFPVEGTPGFTPWPLGKRALTSLTELVFSGLEGAQLGTSEKSHLGYPIHIAVGNCLGKGVGQWTNSPLMWKMVAAREPKANECKYPCLFYTAKLSGAAERAANFVLWNVLETGAVEERRYQTIWDLHDRKYYPRKDNLDDTPETKCAFLDTAKGDPESGFNGCQRLYFMSMSKAMAAECKGEVFLMTTTDLNEFADVPEDGIWWQVEFPTLIDEKRAVDKKVTKITYLQVPNLTDDRLKQLQNLPETEKKPPEVLYQAQYWPLGPGKTQLDKLRAPAGNQGDLQQKRSATTSVDEEDPQQKRSISANGFVKRADSENVQVCVYGEDCYPYPYPMEDMYEWYKDATW